jgi:hypothetical protein
MAHRVMQTVSSWGAASGRRESPSTGERSGRKATDIDIQTLSRRSVDGIGDKT